MLHSSSRAGSVISICALCLCEDRLTDRGDRPRRSRQRAQAVLGPNAVQRRRHIVCKGE